MICLSKIFDLDFFVFFHINFYYTEGELIIIDKYINKSALMFIFSNLSLSLTISLLKRVSSL